MRAIDKLDRLGAEGVRLLLGPGRKDESGDFTKGAGLDADASDRVLASISPHRGTNDHIVTQLGLTSGEGSSQGISEFSEIASLLRISGYDDGRVVIDPSVVRGLEYYTGPVYEGKLPLGPKHAKGSTGRAGTGPR